MQVAIRSQNSAGFPRSVGRRSSCWVRVSMAEVESLWLKLKALFKNVFTFKIWAAYPYTLSVSLIRCKNEALKKLHLKSTIKCFKQVTRFILLISRHRLLCSNLDRDCINFKTFIFLAVYWSIWTSSYNTDIKVLKKIKWSLSNVKRCL